MSDTPVEIKSFYWKGQLRYECPMKWESGAQCEFNTHDLDNMKAHIRAGHSRIGGLKHEIKAQLEKDFNTNIDPQFEQVKFMDESK
jgi:hypothetical protein